MKSSNRLERGIAIVAVLIVLLALVAIATPFALSMRNGQTAAAQHVADSKSTQSLQSTMAEAENAVQRTHVSRDESPHFDSLEELTVAVGKEFERFNLNASDPKGLIASVRVEDEQGKGDINAISPILLNNLITPMRLLGGLEARETKTLNVNSTEGLPDSGLVWIDGEIILYKSKTPRTLTELKRAFSTSVVESLPASDHGNDRPVIDYRVILATVYPYKVVPPEDPSSSGTAIAGKDVDASYAGFPSVRALKDIARFGEMGYRSADLDRAESDLTTFATVPAPDRFGPPVRAIGSYPSTLFPAPVEVTGGRNFNVGTVVRLSAGDRVEYNLITDAQEIGPGRLALRFQEAPRYDYGNDELLIAPLLRAPVNINTCSKTMLVALLTGISMKGSASRVDPDTAEFIATHLIKARTPKGIEGEPGLARLLDSWTKDEQTNKIVTPEIALTVFMNAHNALDTQLETSTAPFCYRALGNVTLHAAVSENLAAGRETTKRMATEVASIAPGGLCQAVLSSQLDFTEAARVARSSPYYTTFPINLADLDNRNEPPVPATSELRYGRYPVVSKEDEVTLAAAGFTPFVRLASVAEDNYRDAMADGAPPVQHFDEPWVPKRLDPDKKLRIDSPDGWTIADRGPFSLGVTDPLINLIGASEFVQPFEFSFWWKPGEGKGETYLFDSGESEISNRIFAYFDGEKLVFRVADSTVPQYATASSDDQKDGGKDPKKKGNSGTSGSAGTSATWPTTMAEVRYGFDDGLKFEKDVWYHLSFYARGTKPTDLVLLVDGVPRGRHAFATRLKKNMGPIQQSGGPFNKIKGYGQGNSEEIEVEDARLFPSEGVVRIGDELIEYTGKDDKKHKLFVNLSKVDPFGGRARRGTHADMPQPQVKQGQQSKNQALTHPETQEVDLYGYAALLASKMMPTGDSTLSDVFGKFVVAMVNPQAKEAKSEIKIKRKDGTLYKIGTGLSATATDIPITGLAKISSSSSSSSSGSSSSGGGMEGSFQKDGGFALIVSAPTPPPSTKSAKIDVPPAPGGGNQNQKEEVVFAWNNFRQTEHGMLGRIEMIYYASYDGGVLSGCKRAGAGFIGGFNWQPKSNLAGTGGKAGGAEADGNEIASIAHDHVLAWEKGLLGKNASKHSNSQPIFVIPISFRVGKSLGSGTNSWAIPEVGGGKGGGKGGGGGGKNVQGGTRPEMIQVGLGFTGTPDGGGMGGTEWLRYDTMANSCFVRDNPIRLSSAGEVVGHYLTANFTQIDGEAPSGDLVARAVNFENIKANKDDKEEILKSIQLVEDENGGAGFEQLLNQFGGCLAFRGVLGTGVKQHSGGERVLPIFRTIRGPDPDQGRPGPRDFVTLVDPKNNSRDEHTINFGYCEPDVEGWGWTCCHVGLDAGIHGTFTGDFYDQVYSIDPDDSDSGWKELANQMLDSRQVSRLLKFPTGELPMKLGEEIHFGGNMQGDPSPAGDTIDELAFFTPSTPYPGFRNHTFIADWFDEKHGEIWVHGAQLRDPSRRKGGPAIEALDLPSHLSGDGLVVSMGQELLAVKSFRVEKAQTGKDGSQDFIVFEVAEGGRGYLGTPIQFHGRGESLRELGFMRVSRLTADLSADGNQLSLMDTSDFPDQGVVQVGHELIGYSRKQGKNQLFMPKIKDGSGKEIGMLRGSYGTPRERHPVESLVYVFPVRYFDRYREGVDVPELGYYGASFNEKRAFYKSLSWKAEGETSRTKLIVEALVGGRGSFGDSPKDNPDRFTFEGDSTMDQQGHAILRQGDVLGLRVFTHYLDGAFDARVFDPDPGEDRGGSNDWKRAPHLAALGLEWIGTPVRLSYEEGH